MFVLLGAEEEGKIYVFVRNGSFIIWRGTSGLDNLNNPKLPPMSQGYWVSFEYEWGSFKRWYRESPEALRVAFCRIAPEHIRELNYQAWPWLGYPLVALVDGDSWDRKDFELVPVTIFKAEAIQETPDDNQA